MTAAKKETTVAKKVEKPQDSNAQQLRLECVRLVMINGTSNDRQKPSQKAEELYSYVVSGKIQE